MKILFPCPSNPYFDSSAISNRYEGIINGLLKNNVEVHLIITEGFNSLGELKAMGRKLNNKNLKISYTICTFQTSLWLRRINKYILSFFLSFITKNKLKRLFCTQYDFLWLTGDIIIRKTFLECKDRITAKSIIELNEFQELHNQSTSSVNPLQQKRDKEYTKITYEVINHIDCFIIMTKTLLSYYKGLSQNENAKFLHLPMTVDLNRFTDIMESSILSKPYIAYTGTYSNQKDGVDILIRSFASINKLYPQYHLYLAGFYHYDVPMQRKLIAEYQLNDKITYLGVLNKEFIPPFILDADLLVLSRPDSKQAQGGFPTKLGEYLATGNPVCVTRVGEIPNYLEDNVSAFMAEPGNEDSFANAMERALFDKPNAKRVGMNGRKVAESHFSIDVQSERLYSFLKENIK